MKNGIRSLAVGMTIISILASTFSGGSVRAKETDKTTKDETKDSVSIDIRPQDDYFGYINAEVLKNADIDPKYGYGSFAECYKVTQEKLYGVIDQINAEGKHSSEDASIIADYYKQIVSYKDVGSDADEDFENVRKEIESISNKQGYMELIGKYNRLYGICPIATFSISEGFTRGDEYSFSFEGMENILGNSNKDIAESEDGRRNLRSHVKDVLVSLGSDKKAAEKKADEFASLAVDIAYFSKDYRAELKNIKTVNDKELSDMKFDIESFSEGYGIKNPYDKWMLAYPEQVAFIADKLEDEKNLDAFKTWLLVEYTDKMNMYFSDNYKAVKDIYGDNTQDQDTVAKDKIINDLPDFIGRIYVENCYPASKDEKVKKMCEDIKQSYREIIGKADWLTEDGRSKLLTKLEAIEFTTGGNFNETFVSTDGIIGRDAYDTYKRILKFNHDNSKEKIKRPRPKMGSTMQPQTVNACFWVDNMVVMTAAITEEPFFSESNSEYANLGGLGMVIAHEVGHAFDSNCINWDDKGVYNPEWLNEKDREALRSRADMCIDYYNKYTIMDVYHVDGNLTLGENYADLGALECISNIAKTNEQYREMYEHFGLIWRSINSDVAGIKNLHSDEHSPGIVRVNAPLSSCDKFYEVYDVKEGDDMYVAPENRIKRW